LGMGAANVVTGTLNYQIFWNNCTAEVFIYTAVGAIAFFVLAAIVLEIVRAISLPKKLSLPHDPVNTPANRSAKGQSAVPQSVEITTAGAPSMAR